MINKKNRSNKSEKDEKIFSVVSEEVTNKLEQSCPLEFFTFS